jgi:NTP pyrophosphatase (non-canonical NTP hydrolase)
MNQYRCETCNCGCTYREIPAQRAFTRDMGCASHSDFQNERDKVLDLLRPEVLHFALRMERKLRTHDDERGKDGWHEAGAFWLLERLQQEVAELETGIEDFSKTSFSGECYDVGNFAMMIASKDLPCPSMDENIKNVIEELRQQAGEP